MNEYSNEIKKSLRALTALLFIGSILFTVLILSELKEYTYIGRDVPAYNTISVQGEGEAFQAPDVATFNFSVTREASSVAQAQTEVSERISEILDGLGEFQIEEKDIKTLSYNAYPRYDFLETICPLGLNCPRGERVLAGYTVTQTISVKIRDLEKLSDVVQKLGELNVDNLNGPNLSIDDEDALIAEAREMAIEDAEEKARQIAKDLDVRIVRVTGFSEGGPYGFGGDFDIARSEALGAPKVDIPIGENRAVIQVNVTYEIK